MRHWPLIVVLLVVAWNDVRGVEESALHRQARELIESLVSSDPIRSAEAKKAIGALPPVAYLFAGDAAQAHAQHATLLIEALAPIKSQWATLINAKIAERVTALHHEFLGYYQHHGQRNPAWNAFAEQGLALVAQDWADDPAIAHESADQAQPVLQQAIDAGCTDPLVRYCHIRMSQIIEIPIPNSNEILNKSARDLQATQLSPLRRLFPLLKDLKTKIGPAGRKPKAEVLKQLDGEIPNLLTLYAATAESLPTSTIAFVDLCDELSDFITTVRGSRKVALELMGQALANASPSLKALDAAIGTTNYAWDARGSGYSNTVTEDGAKLFHERLLAAHAILETAWENDPTDALICAQMITINLGLNGERKIMERWWQRAMRADPHNPKATNNKMYYLEPKWHGSDEDMIDFGRLLLKQGQWEDRFPLQLISAHNKAARYDNIDLYYRQPDVWPDLEQAFSGFLKRFPDQIGERSRYASYAYKAEQWAIANAQFEILQNKPRWGIFSSKSHYDYQRLRARVLSQPISTAITDARKKSEAKKHTEALQTFDQLITQQNNPETLTVLRDERQTAQIRQALDSGEWVSLIVGDDLAGWEPINGTWRREGERLIGIADADYNYFLLRPIIRNFELTGEMSCPINVGGQNVGLIYTYRNGYSNEAVARYGWSAWCLEENFNGRGRKKVDQIPEGPLPFRLVVWDKKVSLYHNDILVNETTITKTDGRIGLGGYYNVRR